MKDKIISINDALDPKVPKGADKVFAEDIKTIADFKFDQNVASVFDDMVNRSVPFYTEMQRMTCEMAKDFALKDTNLVDIGCSTGTTLKALDSYVKEGVRFIGIDNADEMLQKAKVKLEGISHELELRKMDIHEGLNFSNASVVTMLLTLQFLRPLYRDKVAKKIFEGLNKNGCLILIEKLVVEDSIVNRLFIDYYYDYKRRNGYSEIEIAKKREALENVLVPYRIEENQKLLTDAGFRSAEVFFRWYNFCGIIAVK
jgi:tRNA (cmo5U34)-methyltransferase